MRVIFIFLLALVTTAQAQQINPVPDYIFRNQMSVGRNAATDTAAYMSVGPRFGAVKGFMPPMVTDTNSVTGVKRNGLLIFSLQLNNFAYWDSTTARFRKITAEATVDSLLFATRAWRQKGDDSLGGIIAVKTDTGLISTRAYRQKGIDSVVTLISTLGGGTVLSVSAGTGMNFSTITTSGAVNADTLVLSTKAWRQKGDDSVGAIVGTKVNISDTATMLVAYLRKVDTIGMLTPYLRKVDTTAMLTPYVRAANFGLTKSGQTLSSDTAAMATRARVQKGIDSVAGLVTVPDTLTLSTRAWRQKGDDSLGAIIGTKATATGTTNYLSKFTGTSALGNSIVYGTTNEIGISTSTPSEKLDVNGRVRVRTIDSTATGMNMLYSDADGVIKKAAIPAGGSGTVTSVATGYGLSGGTITTTGTLIVDTSAIATRSRVQKGIDSIASVRVGGTGTINYVPKFTGASTLGNSQIFDNGTNVGIGTTSPSGKLHVKGGNAANFYLDNGNEQYTQMIFTRNGIANNGADFLLDSTAKDFGIRTLAAMPFYISTSATAGSPVKRMTITNAGDVGINTTSPSYKLDVSGTLRNTTGAAFATSSGNVLVGTTTDAGYKMDVNGSFRANNTLIEGNTPFYTGSNISATNNMGIGTTSSNVLGLFTSNSERLRIFANGNIGINVAGTDAGYKLDIAGSLRNTTGANFATSSGNVGIGTASPNSKLEIYAATATQVGLSVFTGNETAERTTYSASPALQFSSYQSAAGGPFTKTSDIVANADGTVPSVMRLWTKASGASTPSERMRITAAGLVGIGNTAPTEALHVTGRIRATTIDSTATGMNILYADATGVIKKAAVPSGGSGTVTSITAGTGLTGGTITTSGTIAVDTASIATRARVQKGIDSVITLANAKVSGTGISGYFPKWTGTSTQDTSQLFQLGRNIGIGTATPTYRIHLPDAGNVNAQAMIAGTVLGSDGNGQTIRPSGSVAMALFGQSDIGYIYGAAVSSTGRWGVNTRSLNDATFNVDGSVKIVTIDSTSTARNMLYQDANGVIKKSIALSMADDVMTASGSWVATKDAGSGVTINNVAYTTNGTTKMVTVDGAFYISAELFSDAAWNDVATIPSGFRPQKTVNWNSNFIVTGAEYETSGGTDFTGALSWTYAQMRVTDEGKVQINGSINTNTLDAGGGDYVVIQFTQSYIIK